MTVSLVGYTNAGKSTLMNVLTGADVFVQDALFATLDTRTRRWQLPGWGPVLLSDTVGFIRDLPHHLIESFKATLEEARQAHLLLHVADAANPAVYDQIAAAYSVLEEIGIQEKDTLLVVNKVDALPDRIRLDGLLGRYPNAVPISAQTGFGLANLAAAVSEALSRHFLDVDVELGVENGRAMAYLAAHGEVLSKQFHDSRVTVHCRMPKEHLDRIQNDLLAVRPHNRQTARGFARKRTNMKRDLRNSRAIVTGASSGIGRAVAMELARHGAGLVVTARREDRLRELAAEIVAAKPQAAVEIVVGDITDPATRQRAIDAAQAKLGGLDILVNNAGVGAMGLFVDAVPGAGAPRHGDQLLLAGRNDPARPARC